MGVGQADQAEATVEDWPGIVAGCGDEAWRAAYRLLGNEADASDCLQDAFTAAVVVARRQQVLSWPALLRRLVTARALDRLRKRLRRRTANLGPADETLTDRSPGPLRQVQLAEQAARLREALAQLPPQQAAVFCMRMLDDLSYEQIAEALGISASNAGVLLYRAGPLSASDSQPTRMRRGRCRCTMAEESQFTQDVDEKMDRLVQAVRSTPRPARAAAARAGGYPRPDAGGGAHRAEGPTEFTGWLAAVRWRRPVVAAASVLITLDGRCGGIVALLGRGGVAFAQVKTAIQQAQTIEMTVLATTVARATTRSTCR